MGNEALHDLLTKKELTKSKLNMVYARMFDSLEPNEDDRVEFKTLNEAIDAIFEECERCMPNMPMWKQIIKNDKTKGKKLTMKELIATVMTKSAVLGVADRCIDHNSKEYKLFRRINDGYLTRDMAATIGIKLAKMVRKNE